MVRNLLGSFSELRLRRTWRLHRWLENVSHLARANTKGSMIIKSSSSCSERLDDWQFKATKRRRWDGGSRCPACHVSKVDLFSFNLQHATNSWSYNKLSPSSNHSSSLYPSFEYLSFPYETAAFTYKILSFKLCSYYIPPTTNDTWHQREETRSLKVEQGRVISIAKDLIFRKCVWRQKPFNFQPDLNYTSKC